MPVYRIELRASFFEDIEVEASNLQEAKEIAEDLLQNDITDPAVQERCHILNYHQMEPSEAMWDVGEVNWVRDSDDEEESDPESCAECGSPSGAVHGATCPRGEG